MIKLGTNNDLVFNIEIIDESNLIDRKNKLLDELKGVFDNFKKDIGTIPKNIGSRNVDDDIYEFSAFLTPIIASITETYMNNPFLCESAWKNKLNYYDGGTHNISGAVMKEFSSLMAYLEYENREDGKEMDLKAYECMVYEACYKIDQFISKRKLNNLDRCFQYYEVESLYGAMFIDKVVDILDKKLPKFRSYEELDGKLDWLAENLKEIYAFDPITRIALVQNILERLMVDAEKDSLRKLKKRESWLSDNVIVALKEMARIREWLILEDWQQAGLDEKNYLILTQYGETIKAYWRTLVNTLNDMILGRKRF